MLLFESWLVLKAVETATLTIPNFVPQERTVSLHFPIVRSNPDGVILFQSVQARGYHYFISASSLDLLNERAELDREVVLGCQSPARWPPEARSRLTSCLPVVTLSI